MDRLTPILGEPVVIQCGDGQYMPRHAQHFRFVPSLQPYYEQASLVVSHGGKGTCLEVLAAGKSLIAVDNPDRYDRHQTDLLRALEADGFLIWCRRIGQLEQTIARAKVTLFRRYEPPDCTIHVHIRQLLEPLPRPTHPPAIERVAARDALDETLHHAP